MLVRSEDPLWDVRAREREIEARLRAELAAVQAERDLIRRTEALRHATGFSDFLRSLEVMHKAARERLVGDERLTNEGLREQRGRVKGLEAVLALLTSSSQANALAEREQQLQNDLDIELQRRPKPRPIPTEVTQ